MLKAMNFVTRLDALPHALGGRARSGRNLFMVPWKGRALFGTWESAQRSDPDDRRPHCSDIDSFLEDVNQAFPSAALARHDIPHWCIGVLFPRSCVETGACRWRATIKCTITPGAASKG